MKGDDIPETVANEIRISCKKKFLKLYTIIPNPKDVMLDILPFFFTQAIALALPDLFV